MGCIYGNHENECSMFDGDVMELGCDEDGLCYASSDPDPNFGCDAYESDFTCPECGQDLNIADCACCENEEEDF